MNFTILKCKSPFWLVNSYSPVMQHIIYQINQMQFLCKWSADIQSPKKIYKQNECVVVCVPTVERQSTRRIERTFDTPTSVSI